MWAWSTQDTVFEVVYAVLLLVDWHQTREIADHPDLWHEHNPVLGQHPSVRAVDTYMAASLILHPAMSALIPQEYRPWWQSMSIGFELGCNTINFKIGIR